MVFNYNSEKRGSSFTSDYFNLPPTGVVMAQAQLLHVCLCVC